MLYCQNPDCRAYLGSAGKDECHICGHREAPPEPATAARGELEIDVVISPKGGVSADFSSDKTCRAYAEQIRKFNGFEAEPATVAVDARALAELRHAIGRLNELAQSTSGNCWTRQAEVIALNAARRLLAGGE